MNRSNVDNSELCLLEQAARGERDARRELFELHREAAYRVALRVTGRYEDALDVVQDGFIRAFERLGEFQQTAGFRTWLLRIVTNRALDLLRARKVRLAVSLDGGDDESRAAPAISGAEQRPDAAMQQRELGQRLRQAVEALPLEQRAVFALSTEGEMTYGQIAEVVGVPIGTVMSRLYHARRRLRDLLEDLAPREEKLEQQ